MKVILSRKGFDSANGGGPSPVLPDGRMLSLPIPQDCPGAGLPYSQIKAGSNLSYLGIMKQLEIRRLKKGRFAEDLLGISEAHLDPDIHRQILDRHPEWRALFGQAGAAQGHLIKQRIDKGDIFLFFGLFRKTKCRDEQIEWMTGERGAPFHSIFGYLEVGDICQITCQDEADQFHKSYPWADYHPHMKGWQQYAEPRTGQHNTVYVASKQLSFAERLPGAGVLHYDDRLRLTRSGCSPSRWCLPPCFLETTMTYHKPGNWRKAGGEPYLQSAYPGQEFVVKTTEDVRNWARNLIGESSLN
ncbi:MAG: hypothetical protein EXR60_06365 [Dehalococcoidia bacterium]|nr:hypothetical protein [Dehalococcoidia bacterium]